jgi:hypothetical protein
MTVLLFRGVSGFCAPAICPLPFVSVAEKRAGLKSGFPGVSRPCGKKKRLHRDAAQRNLSGKKDKTLPNLSLAFPRRSQGVHRNLFSVFSVPSV